MLSFPRYLFFGEVPVTYREQHKDQFRRTICIYSIKTPSLIAGHPNGRYRQSGTMQSALSLARDSLARQVPTGVSSVSISTGSEFEFWCPHDGTLTRDPPAKPAPQRGLTPPPTGDHEIQMLSITKLRRAIHTIDAHSWMAFL